MFFSGATATLAPQLHGRQLTSPRRCRKLTTPLMYFSMSGALNSRLRSARRLPSSLATPMLDSCRRANHTSFWIFFSSEDMLLDQCAQDSYASAQLGSHSHACC